MSPSGDGDAPSPVPAVYRRTERTLGPVLFTLEVDGERFAIRRAGYGGTAYDWLLNQRWRALQHITASPSKIGDIARAALVLTHFEHGHIT